MARPRVILNRRGVRDLLRSPEVQSDLSRRAGNIARAAGDGHEVDSEVGDERARASVRTVTADAMRDEVESKRLTRAIDAGRR